MDIFILKKVNFLADTNFYITSSIFQIPYKILKYSIVVHLYNEIHNNYYNKITTERNT